MAIPPIKSNPYRPGAGHMPPYLAGRDGELKEFEKLLDQNPVLTNIVLTGLRGVGKTVLLETLKPIAIKHDWLWAGTDLSESTSISEDKMALRILTDLSVVTSSIVLATEMEVGIGFAPNPKEVKHTLGFTTLAAIYEATPGLVSDKLKRVLEVVWAGLQKDQKRGIIFAYDEAQTLADHAAKDQFPLSLLLDVFQSIQKKNIPFMLLLTGLPTLFPKLVEARTFSERMFRVLFVDKLDEQSTKDAITKPLKNTGIPPFTDNTVKMFWEASAGYPYFIQFFCREAFDVFIQQSTATGAVAGAPMAEIIRKLDSDFFAGRWSRATDRQRDLMRVVATLSNCDSEFTVQEVVEASKTTDNPFGNSHVNQMFVALADAGLVYKNRHGKYSFAVPLLHKFILRQAN